MNTPDDCKYFGYKACKYSDNEIMKRATQDIPRYYGGRLPVLDFPDPKEVEAICSECDKFTPK
jgi:hypothetical protein